MTHFCKFFRVTFRDSEIPSSFYFDLFFYFLTDLIIYIFRKYNYQRKHFSELIYLLTKMPALRQTQIHAKIYS